MYQVLGSISCIERGREGERERGEERDGSLFTLEMQQVKEEEKDSFL
jgi:hypothetical protein